MWQSSLPAVETIALCPPFVTDRKWCGGWRSAHRVDGDADVAVGAVLEADGAGEAGGELAVDLRLRRAGADRAPGDEVGDVLRRDHVEELAAHRHAHLVEVEQQLAGDAQALVDLEAAVQVRVVDQALPADGRARLLEVDAHDDEHVLAQALAHFLEPAGVLLRRVDVVDRAGADDRDNAVVGAVEDAVDRLSGLKGVLRRRFRDRKLVQQLSRRSQLFDLDDAQVVGLVLHIDIHVFGSCHHFTSLKGFAGL